MGNKKNGYATTLDFCGKYSFSPTHRESLPNFIRKLQEKKQTKPKQEQAETAIKMYYQTVKSISFSNAKHKSQRNQYLL